MPDNPGTRFSRSLLHVVEGYPGCGSSDEAEWNRTSGFANEFEYDLSCLLRPNRLDLFAGAEKVTFRWLFHQAANNDALRSSEHIPFSQETYQPILPIVAFALCHKIGHLDELLLK